MKTTFEKRQFIKNHMDKPTAWLAKELGIASRTVREHKTAIKNGQMGEPPKTEEEMMAEDLEKLRSSSTEKATDKKYKIALKEIERLKRMIKSIQKSMAERQASWDSGEYAAQYNTLAGAKMLFSARQSVEQEALDAAKKALAALQN